MATPDAQPLLSESRSLCTDYQCPNCGAPDHVTAERVLIGHETLTLCHCRICGHSWHPQIEADPT
jgi:transcription elongation factor Elf1